MQRNQICTQKLQRWIQIGAYRQYCMAWRGLCKLRAKFQGQEKGKKGKREKGKKGKREKGRMVRLILTVKGFYSGFSCILKFYASDTSINQAISFCILSPESRFASDDSKFAYSGKP